MVSEKLATLGVLKIKIFQNKDYEIIIPDYDVTKNVVIWPKFANSSISMRKVIIT